MRRCFLFVVCLMLAGCGKVSPESKEALNEAGGSVKKAAKDVGKAGKELGKDALKAAKEVGKKAGDAVKGLAGNAKDVLNKEDSNEEPEKNGTTEENN